MKDNKIKHILLVRSGYPSKEAVLKKIKSLGYYIIILDTEKTCPDNLVDEWIFADLSSSEKCIEAVSNYLQESTHFIDGVLTFWDEAVILTSKLSNHFKWIGISPESAYEIKNKYKFRRACKKNGLPVPRHTFLSSEEDIEKIKNLSFPLVIKPVFGAASAFVMKSNNKQELLNEYRQIKKYIKTFWLSPEWEDTTVYVEEYIDGQEVDIDILIQNGEVKFYSITDNFSTNEPYFVETGQAIPSSLSNKKQNELIEMAENVLKTLNVLNGCIHFEAKSSSKGPMPIEINLRMGGDEVYSFVENAWGVNLVEFAVKIALGEKIIINKPTVPKMRLEGRYFLPEKEGRIKKITVSNLVLNNPNILEVHLSKNKNDTITLPPKDFDYLGWITAKGETPEQAHKNLEESFLQIKFSVN